MTMLRSTSVVDQLVSELATRRRAAADRRAAYLSLIQAIVRDDPRPSTTPTSIKRRRPTVISTPTRRAA